MKSVSLLSIIVPVLNERPIIHDFLNHLEKQSYYENEIIVVDGGSRDGTYEYLLERKGIQTIRKQTGRAKQMNAGSKLATGNWFYFVHADCKLPKDYDKIVLDAVKNGSRAGCFRLDFDSTNLLLKCAAYGSRWNHLLCRGGDQTLFIERPLFFQLNGFDENYKVCEDINLVRRICKTSHFTVLKNTVETSSRKFHKKGTFYLWIHFRILHLLHWVKVNPHYLYAYYKKVVGF